MSATCVWALTMHHHLRDMAPLARPAAPLSLIARWRWNILAALFAALVLVALSLHRWRCAELVEPDSGQAPAPRFGGRGLVGSLVLGSAIVVGVLVFLPAQNDEAAVVLASAGWPEAVAQDSWADPRPDAGDERADMRCAQCGVVESMREIVEFLDDINSGVAVATARGGRVAPPTSIRNVEVTVRMKDGVSHLFRVASSANWRAGERVIFIDGRRPGGD